MFLDQWNCCDLSVQTLFTVKRPIDTAKESNSAQSFPACIISLLRHVQKDILNMHPVKVTNI